MQKPKLVSVPKGRPKKYARNIQVSTRLEELLVKELDELAIDMEDESPGLVVTRADVLRLTITRGLETVLKERKG